MKEKAQLDDKTKAVFDRKGYQVEWKISEGAFGQVYTAKNMKRNEVDAVKVMDLNKLSENFKSKFLTREIMTLIKVRHPYVLRIFDIFRSAQHVYIFMEFAPNGTLSTQVKNAPDGFLSESKSKFWFQQTVEALECMHTVHKICHR
jgi:serine/threonine protein kinase